MTIQAWKPPRRWAIAKGQEWTSTNADCRGVLVEMTRRAERRLAEDEVLKQGGDDVLEHLVHVDMNKEQPDDLAGHDRVAPPHVGIGARLNYQIKHLMRERNVVGPDPEPLPLSEPVSGPQLLKGVCSRTEVDERHTLLAPFALTWDPDNLPPLKLSHGSENVGEIIDLHYDGLGTALTIVCRVDDLTAARQPAFSACFTPTASPELVDRGGQNFHFRIGKGGARIDEISLVSQPALRSATVDVRVAAPPRIEDPRFRAVSNQIALIHVSLAA